MFLQSAEADLTHGDEVKQTRVNKDPQHRQTGEAHRTKDATRVMIAEDETIRFRTSARTAALTTREMLDVQHEGKQCGKCRKWNHFSKVCKSVCEIHEYHSSDEYQESVDVDDVSDQFDGFFIDCIAK